MEVEIKYPPDRLYFNIDYSEHASLFSDSKIMLIEICLPVYNEEKIIEKNALFLQNFCQKQNFRFDWQIVVLDNGSTDGTNKICETLEDKGFKVAYLPIKGKGWAINQYFSKSPADITAYMDIDLAVSLNDLNNLLSAVINNEADLAIGSRLLSGSKIDRSLIREASSQIYNLLSRLLCHHKFSDLQCGFKAIKTEAFRKIAPYIHDRQWFFDTELVLFANALKYKVVEIPVEWSENRYDKRKSKVNLLKDTSVFVLNLMRLRRRLAKFGQEKTANS